MDDENEEIVEEIEQEGSISTIYEMSDEDFINSNPDDFEHQDLDNNDGNEETDEQSDEQGSDTDSDDGSEDATEMDESDESGDDSDDGDLVDNSDAEDESDTSSDISSSESSDSEETSDTSSEETESEIDYKAEFEALTSEFNASGSKMSVKSVAEARTLMQKGVDYQRKMQALAPHLRTSKILERNKIDAEQLNYLVDLHNKKPGAIQRLLKESEVDPLSFDTDEENDYTPTKHDNAGIDQELNIDATIETVQQTPTGAKTLNIVGNEWDTASKQAVGDNPLILEYINDHVANGIYDIINTEMTRQRSLGNLSNLSDFDLYQQVGNDIDSKGGFDSLNLNNTQQPQTKAKPPAKKVITPKPDTSNKDLSSKRREASANTNTSKTSTRSDTNPLSMSDADFAKLVGIQI